MMLEINAMPTPSIKEDRIVIKMFFALSTDQIDGNRFAVLIVNGEAYGFLEGVSVGMMPYCMRSVF